MESGLFVYLYGANILYNAAVNLTAALMEGIGAHILLTTTYCIWGR